MAAILDPKAAATRRWQFIDKEWLREQIAAHDAHTGFLPIPGMTAEKAREIIRQIMLSRGIDPDSLIYDQD